MITGEAKAKRNHEDRMSDSLIHNSCEVSKMSHLTKDHKLVGEDGLPPTRPVVSACPSERAQGVKVLSTEHMLQKTHCLQPQMEYSQTFYRTLPDHNGCSSPVSQY